MTFAFQNPDGPGQQSEAPDPVTVGTESQQPEKTEPGKGQPGSTVQPEKTGEGPVTLDALRQIIHEEVPSIVEDKVGRIYRGVQTQNANLEKRVKADLQQQIADLKKSGIVPNAEQTQALLDQTRERVLTESEKAGPKDQAPAHEETPQVHPVVSIAMEMIKEAGLESIPENSPSYKLIDQVTDKPSVFLKSVEKAVEAEVARLQVESNTRARNPSIAAGAGKGAGSGIANNNNIKDLYEQGFGIK